MLDRAGDAAGNVQIGADCLAGLAHLVCIGNPACIHRRARRPHGRAQRLRQLAHRLEPFRPGDAAPTRDDDAGVGQTHAALRLFEARHLGWDVVLSQDRLHPAHLATAAAVRLRPGEGAHAGGKDLRSPLRDSTLGE